MYFLAVLYSESYILSPEKYDPEVIRLKGFPTYLINLNTIYNTTYNHQNCC